MTTAVKHIYADQWQTVRKGLARECGQAVYSSWLKPLELQGISDGTIRLIAPTRFIRDWVMHNYKDELVRHWMAEDPEILALSIEVANDSNNPDDAPKSVAFEDDEPILPPPAESLSTPHIKASDKSKTASAQSFSAPLDPRLTFDNFVVGKPNELACAAAQRVADSATVSFNPLFLYGGVGLGKTHLMHAIAWHIRAKHPERQVAYITAEKFMYLFIRALRYKDTVAFKEMFRNVDVLMIDDVQFISGKESTQEEFFHTFNALVDNNRQVILSADQSPSELDGIEERLKSRLGWGLVADIHPTTYELRLGILQSNVRELEGAMTRIVAHATFVGRKINIETTQDVLKDLLRANDRKVTIEEIQRRTAEHYNIKVSDMHSVRRARIVARPRQIAMYLSKVLTTSSLPDIGRKFGGRDHTTVMHAVQKVEQLMGDDSSIREDISLLKRLLES